MELLIHLMLVVLFWAWLSLVFVGWGLLLRGLFRTRIAEVQDVFVSGFLGWGCVVAFLQLWHLVFSVNSAAFGFVCVVGVAGVMASIKQLRALTWGKRRMAACGVIFGGLVAFWLSNHTVMQPAIYDSGLYHLNVVRWNGTFPVVPGLGNLHGRFGYNNSSLLYSAMLDVGPFTNRSHHVASGWLILWTFMRCLFGGYELFKRGGPSRMETMYYALLVAPIFAWTVNTGYASSHSPDVASFMLAIVVGGELMAMAHHEGREGNGTLSRFLNIAFLSAVGISVKLSFLVYGIGMCAVALLALYTQRGALRHLLRPLCAAASLVCIVLLPWCVRGVILNGYPAYPAKIMRFDLDWTVPESSSDIMRMQIKAWARMPDVPPEQVLQSWSWVRPWVERVFSQNVFDVRLPLMTIVLASILFGFQMQQGPRMEKRRIALLCAPSFGAMTFWFWSAPDPRFLGSISWVLAAYLLVLALQHRRAWALPLLLAHSLVLLAALVNPIDALRTWKDPSPAQRIPMDTLTTRSGLKVLVPKEGDQCWDAALPCTPYFNSRLALRAPGGLSRGFKKVR